MRQRTRVPPRDEPIRRDYTENEARRFERVFFVMSQYGELRETLKALLNDEELNNEPWSFSYLLDMIEGEKFKQWRRDWMALKKQQAIVNAFRALSNPEKAEFGKQVVANTYLAIAAGRLEEATRKLDKFSGGGLPRRVTFRGEERDIGDELDEGTARVLDMIAPREEE